MYTKNYPKGAFHEIAGNAISNQPAAHWGSSSGVGVSCSKCAPRRSLFLNIAEILLTILHKKDESFPQAIGIAQKTAADFWDLGADN
jgi:hypothetical protein